jgi:hypothetical protein
MVSERLVPRITFFVCFLFLGLAVKIIALFLFLFQVKILETAEDIQERREQVLNR